MKNKGLIATIVVLIAVIITLIAVMVLMQMPTILSSEGLPGSFIGKKESTIVSTVETTESKNDSQETTEQLPKLSTKIENYTAYKDHVSIDYPQITGMDDIELQEKINNKIKVNAISIVPLYPISTAVQNLNISCEVKRLDEEYITIVYEGKVLGVKSSGSSSSGSKSSSGSSSSSGSGRNQSGGDPYLDGFVDPLTVLGQNLEQIISMPQTAEAVINYVPQTTARSGNAEITYNNNQNNSVVPNPNNRGTADKGPTVTDIKAPTAANQSYSSVASENMATNNPTAGPASVIVNEYSSNGVYYSQSGTQVAPIETSSANSVTYSLPVYGFANTSPNDIDQKIYYSNTISLKSGIDMKLGDYVDDFDALAKYLRSSKVEFVNIDDDDRKAVREYVNKTVQSKYVEQMKSADFRNEGVTAWPKIFSYMDTDGVVYFSVKLSGKFGNYAIVKYEQ